MQYCVCTLLPQSDNHYVVYLSGMLQDMFMFYVF